MGILVGGGEVGFLDVAGKDGGLVGHQPEQAGDGLFFGGELEGDDGFAGIQMGFELGENGVLGHALLVAALHVLGHAGAAFLDAVEVGEGEFGGDGFDVAHGVHVAGHVMDVRIFKAADDLDDGIHFANVGEEFIAETFAGAGAFYEAGDVHKFNGGGNGDLRFGDGFEHGQAGIGDGDDADIGVNGAEGIVGGHRLAGAGDGVEQG